MNQKVFTDWCSSANQQLTHVDNRWSYNIRLVFISSPVDCSDQTRHTTLVNTYDVRRSFVKPRPPLSDERRQRLECSDVDAADEVTKFTLGVDIPCTHVTLRLVGDEVPSRTHLTPNQLIHYTQVGRCVASTRNEEDRRPFNGWKQLNWSCCHTDCGLGLAQGIIN